MCDVRDFTFAMNLASDGEVKFGIRFMEKDMMREFTFDTAKAWLKTVAEGFGYGRTAAELVREFKEVWWDTLFFDEFGSVREYWNEKGYSVDEDSLQQAGKNLMCALRAFAEGSRIFTEFGREIKNGDYVEAYWRT